MANTGSRGGPHGRDEGDRNQGDREREQYREHERDHEPYDGPAEHLEIERRRVAGGLPPTPERYARAREQWYRLPGVSIARRPGEAVDGYECWGHQRRGYGRARSRA